MRKKSSGFTLIELLVAVGLMVILMTAIVLIFHRSTDVMKINDARLQIFENVRAAVDTIAGDIQNSANLDSEVQRFHMKNYVRPAAGGVGAGTTDGTEGARDYIGFVTVAPAPVAATRELKSVFVEYFLRNSDDGETSFTGAGFTTGMRSKRAIFSLIRRMWALPVVTGTTDPLRSALLSGVPLGTTTYATTITVPAAPAGAFTYSGVVGIEDGDICQWIESMDIEACYPTSSVPTDPLVYLKLDETSNSNYVIADMPLIGPVMCGLIGKTQVTRIPRKLRFSFRVVEGSAERQERLIQREIWVPSGS